VEATGRIDSSIGHQKIHTGSEWLRDFQVDASGGAVSDHYPTRPLLGRCLA